MDSTPSRIVQEWNVGPTAQPKNVIVLIHRGFQCALFADCGAIFSYKSRFCRLLHCMPGGLPIDIMPSNQCASFSLSEV